MKHLLSYKLFEKLVLPDNKTETDIRNAGWLYFLTYVYPEGMKNVSWNHDDRMGVLFPHSMNYWVNAGLVEYKGGLFKLTDPDEARDILYSTFGRYNSEADAEDSVDKFSKYDTKDYPIGSIPLEMFRRDTDAEYKNANRREVLDSQAYDNIRTWYKKYQRINQGWWTKLNRYLGAEGELFPKKDEYVLYRGIKVTTRPGFRNSINFEPSVGSTVSDSGESWTWSPHVASKFSIGQDNWMSQKQLGDGEIGLILKYSFDPGDILMDTNFVEDKMGVDFPDEMEVIVRPAKRKAEVYKVIYPKPKADKIAA